MGVPLELLSPQAQRQVIQKIGHLPRGSKIPGISKYHNIPTELATEDGNKIKFASKKEARRFSELMIEMKNGDIQELKLQVDFVLVRAYTCPTTGIRHRSMIYRADFAYYRGGRLIVEDVKGMRVRPKEYELKRKLMREIYGIEIVEV